MKAKELESHQLFFLHDDNTVIYKMIKEIESHIDGAIIDIQIQAVAYKAQGFWYQFVAETSPKMINPYSVVYPLK